MEIFGLTFGRKDKNKNNPSSEVFDATINTELENVIDTYAATALRDKANKENELNSGDGIAPDIHSDSFKDVTCMPINSNKMARLRQYNIMSRFAEIGWAVDEISMDYFHEDENKKIINLDIQNVKYLDDKKQDILQNEFNHFIKLFDFEQNGYTLIKNYIIEGEAAWENVIDPNAPEKGIRALKYIPTKYYDFIKDRKTGQILGIYFDKDQVNYDILTGVLSNSYSGAANIFNAISTMPGYTYSMSMTENKIPLYWPQITYFNSGLYNFENTIVYPLLENASAPYQQLSLLQDAAVILRITRAPERLVFNISTGGMPEKKAKTMVNTFINNFKSKKVSNSKGETRNSYDPAAMLDAYFFWKQDGSEGSSVQALNSTADFDKMGDIDYFLRRIFKAFKIPYTRFKEEGVAVQRKETITYEEYSFTRYIIRQQKVFANAIKQSFITHLKLRKIWEEYNLNDTLIKVEFVKPSLYELYNAQQLSNLKMTIFKEAIENETMSVGLAMQQYLGYSEEKVKHNFMKKREELLFAAETEYYIEKMKKNGPVDTTTSPIKMKKDEEVSQYGDIGGGGNSEDIGNPLEIPSASNSSTKSPNTPNDTSSNITINPGEESLNTSNENPENSNNELPPLEQLPEEPNNSEEEEAEQSPEINQSNEVIPGLSPTQITNIETPSEYAGVDLLKKPAEYPEEFEAEKSNNTSNEVPVKTEKAPTFREIFSKLNK